MEFLMFIYDSPLACEVISKMLHERFREFQILFFFSIFKFISSGLISSECSPLEFQMKYM